MVATAPRETDELALGLDPLRGVYDVRRAAALSGVPQRTLSYWAERGIYHPSISPDPRPRLWPWYDLVALRTIDWLRHPTDDIRTVPVNRVRQMFEQLDRRGLSRSELHDLVVRTSQGELFLDVDDRLVRADDTGQTALPGMLAVVRTYKGAPDLLEPRPLLRIIPGKLSGEPHVAGTRISSQALYALYDQGYSLEQIHQMYPDAGPDAVREAIDLERSLSARAA